MKRSSAVKLAILLLLTAALATIALGGLNLGMVRVKPVGRAFERGLDLGGGTYTLYTGKADGEQADSWDKAAAADILARRLSDLGYPEAVVAVQGDKLRVEMPDTSGAKTSLNAATAQLKLNFTAADGTVVLENRHFASFKHTVSSSGYYAVGFTLNSEGKKAYEDAKTAFAGQSLSVTLDGAELTTLSVDSGITNGQGQFIGFNTSGKARQTAMLLGRGALPAALTASSNGALDAALGISALHNCVVAGGIVLALIAIFLVVFYRLPGLSAVVSILLFLLLTAYGLLLFPSVTVSLYSALGVAVAVAFAVCAHVMLFNRMRGEIGMGRPVRASVTAAYKQLGGKVGDAGAVLLLAAFGLLILGNASVRVFAVTVLIGTLAALLCTLAVTRSLLNGLLDVKLSKPALYAAKAGKTGNIANTSGKGAANGKTFLIVSAVVLIAGLIVGLAVPGLAGGLNNPGGSIITLWVGKSFTVRELEPALASVGIEHAAIASAQNGAAAVIRTSLLDEAAAQQVKENLAGALSAGYPDANVQSVDTLGAAANAGAVGNLIASAALGCLLVLGYLALRQGFATAAGVGLTGFIAVLVLLALAALIGLPLSGLAAAVALAAMGLSLTGAMLALSLRKA